MPVKKKDIKKSILVRVRMLYLLMFLAGLAIAGKILYIQYGPDGDDLRSRGEEITYERRTLEAERGDILANDGSVLATSIPLYEVRMDFAANGLVDSVFYRNVDSLAFCLSAFYGDKNAAAYKDILVRSYGDRSGNRYKLISPRRVDYIELQTVKRFPLFRLGANRGGFIPAPVQRRVKPYGAMAGRTIGMTNESGTKVGIEGAFDTILKGIDGNELTQRISGNFRIPVPDELSAAPVDGIDVVSTIDVDIQDVAESALRRQLTETKADWGTAILMEIKTGEVRAISNLTRKPDGSVVEDFNYAIGMNLEPGSTIKLVSLMTLLDDAGAGLDETFDTGNGTAVIGRATVRDTHGYGKLTLAQIFEKSSNIGFAKAVNKYYADKPEKYVDHLKKMGLDLPLDLQIAGEQAPVMRYPGERWWDRTTLTMMSYGYAVRLTPLKTLTIYNAVANGGEMVRPVFVKELRRYGQTVRRYATDVMVPKIASDATIKTVQQAMQDVVDEGTAAILRNPRYKTAAKTGTAQVAQGRSGYTDSRGGRHYIGTMAGYFPAEDPKYSLIVLMKTYTAPHDRRVYYGAPLAGPVFKAIADRVYARNTSWQNPLSATTTPQTGDTIPIKSGNAPQIRAVSRKFDIPYDAGRRVQWLAYTETDSTGLRLSPLSDDGSVPSVEGMGLKDALYLLEKEGLVVTFSGRGQVISQSPEAGTPVERGALVSLRLDN